jgi:hypothetical protein
MHINYEHVHPALLGHKIYHKKYKLRAWDSRRLTMAILKRFFCSLLASLIHIRLAAR